jgi:alpha-beta hydrolase superfamily lysophospholipase
MSTLSTHDGLQLYVHDWPAPPQARGRVLLVHGLGEHCRRYDHVAQTLIDAGWQVRGYDHRGHGRSQGSLGSIAAYDDLLQDLALVIDDFQGPGPLVVLGHSMGGLVAARFVAEALAPSPAAWSRPVDRLVLSSPALAADLNLGQKLALKIALPLAPALAVNNGLKPNWISRDDAVVRAYVGDTLVHDRITARLTDFILSSGELVRARVANWRTPTLLMWAGADRCVAPRGSEAMAADAPAAVLTTRPWPGLYHEIFNEPEKGQVLAELVRWLNG